MLSGAVIEVRVVFSMVMVLVTEKRVHVPDEQADRGSMNPLQMARRTKQRL